MMRRTTLSALLLLGLGLAAGFFGLAQQGQDKEDKTLLLDIGDRALRGKTVDIEAGQIYSGATGKAVAFEPMASDLASCRFVYVGETHNSLPMHEIQGRIIRALYERDRSLVIGLEMFPVTAQEALNAWSLGLLTEEEFMRRGLWYVNWNFNFGYYRKIFEFAKENGIPLYALNAPKDVITKIRMKGWEALTDDEKAVVPQPDLTVQDHRTLIRAIFESSELPPQMKGAGLDMMFEGLYRSQSAWDEVMAANARKAWEVERKRVVVLAGSGHVLYNLGINRRVFDKNRSPFRTIVCVTIPEGKSSMKVARTVADYIWALPEEQRPAYPEVGLAFKKFEGLENLVVERKPIDGAALAADFDKGDVVLSVDGRRFTDANELRMHLARLDWGQEVKFRILRGGQEKDVVLMLAQPAPERRDAPKKP